MLYRRLYNFDFDTMREVADKMRRNCGSIVAVNSRDDGPGSDYRLMAATLTFRSGVLASAVISRLA